MGSQDGMKPVKPSRRSSASLYMTAIIKTLLIEDAAEYKRQWDYLADGFFRSELFRETMGWDWLQRHGYLLGGSTCCEECHARTNTERVTTTAGAMDEAMDSDRLLEP